MLCGLNRVLPRTWDKQHETDVNFSLNDVNDVRLDGQALGKVLDDQINELVERIGIEPMTPCLQSRCSSI